VLVDRLGVPKRTLQNWDAGDHPQRRHLPKIAALFGVELAEAVKGLWGENLGDPCPCGCGGKKVLPDFEAAHHLYIELACGECGTKRAFRSPTGQVHHRLCRRCAYASRRFERVEFTCVGYRDHDRLERHAPKCPRKMTMLLSRIRYYHSIRKENPKSPQPPFLAEALRTFRCKPCASASLGIASTERKLKRFQVERFGSAEPIRSQRQRSEILSTYHAELNQAFIRSRPRALKAAKAAHVRGESPNRVKGLTARYWTGKSLPRSIEVHRCVFCGKLTLTRHGRSQFHYHKPCYRAWSITPEGNRYHRGLRQRHQRTIFPSEKRGRPLAEENLKIHFAWAVQHYFGGASLRAIAQENSVHFTSVSEHIGFIINNLPAPDLVSRSFRPRVCITHAASW
jgi:hypothetical protein